jgi:hemoglobin/transferrin/lactoferrin receptor protein
LVVENKANNQPLEMATVSSIKPNLFATTDAKGEVDISKFQNVEEIEIRVLGFDNQTVSYKQLMNWNFEIKLKPSEEVLKAIIVTANKAEEQKENVPQTIVTISASEIKTQNYQNMADVLQNSGVVSVQKSQQGGGSPVIRGFEANRVLITVDGTLLNYLWKRCFGWCYCHSNHQT